MSSSNINRSRLYFEKDTHILGDDLNCNWLLIVVFHATVNVAVTAVAEYLGHVDSISANLLSSHMCINNVDVLEGFNL